MALNSTIGKIIQRVGKVLLVVSIVLVFVIGLLIKTDDVKIPTNPRIQITGGWVNADTNQEILGDTIEVQSTEHVVLRRKLPSSIGDGEVMSYYDRGFHVVAYVDGATIYESGLNSYNNRGREIGAAWRMIPLDSRMSGEEILICLENNTETTLSLQLNNVYIGSESDLVCIIIKSNAIPLTCTGICLIFSIIFFIFGSNLFRFGMTKYVRRIYPLGAMTFFMGVWVYADSTLAQIWASNSSIRFYLTYFAFTLAPLTLNAFYQDIIEEERIVFRILCACYKFGISICLILYLFELIYFPNIVFLIHAYMLTLVLLIGYGSIKSFKQEKSLYNLGNLLGFSVMIGFIGVGIYIYYFKTRSILSGFIGIGYILYVIVVSITQLRDIVYEYRIAQQKHDYKIMASIDSVTGGNSALVVREWLERDSFFAEGAPWIVNMNIEQFGAVNMSLGWEYGNEILKGIYDTCKDCVKEGELISHLGNANFGFLLKPGTDVEAFCVEVENKFIEYINRDWKGLALNVKFAAKHIQKGNSLETVLDHLQMAYTSPLAKYSSVSRCYYYTEACQEQLKKEYLMENQIGAAVYNDEFRLYLQVMVDPKKNEVIGAEALVRWDSPMFGIIQPETFIPIAEKGGQIRVVDLHIFKTLLKYLVERDKRGLSEINVSVNISQNVFHREHFLEDYRSIIEEMGVEPGRIAFELSEVLTTENLDAVQESIDEIHEMGCRVFLDNFGSGSFNIVALGRLKFNFVKLDRSCLENDFENNPIQQKMVKGLIDMLHTMSRYVIAQGVETKKQRDLLRDMGVDLIQGFFYAKPVDIDDFEATQFMNPVD